MKKTFRYVHFALLTSLTILGLFSGSLQANTSGDAPLFEKVTVVPFVVEPQPFEGDPIRSDQDKILSQLSEEATKQAEHTLLHHKIASAVVRGAASDTATGQPVVTGVVRLPLSLPRDVIGLRAEMRRGRFATGKVTLRNAAGKIIVEREVELVWGDAFWTRGAKIRRNRPLDEVLAHFARKTADRAIRQIKQQLR